tara:strand:+ start:379 stop:1029 length:651 start_codon:yes stop_codon:yes gene_type:complete
MKATINVPTSLDEITLKQYQKYLAEQKINEDEYNLQLKAIEIFCNVPENSVKKIIAKDVRKITEKIAELFNSEPPLLKSFKMQGVEYGFIPNLDEITFGEYIDLDTYIPQWENMHLAMNVLYRPIAHRSSGRYELVPYSTITPEKSLGAPMSAVLGSLFFLFNLGRDLLMITQNYLKEEVETQQVQSANLDKSLVGMAACLDLAKETLLNLKISPK